MINLDKYSYHEAVDRASVACDHFYDYVACHPVVQSNQELKEAAEKIVALMNEFSGLCARYSDLPNDKKAQAEKDGDESDGFEEACPVCGKGWDPCSFCRQDVPHQQCVDDKMCHECAMKAKYGEYGRKEGE
jgi:hypothetical protein